MTHFQWIGQLEPDQFDLSEQVGDAAGIACAALEDAKRDPGAVAGALADAQAQLQIARDLAAQVTDPAFSASAQAAVARAEQCTASIRALQPEKTSNVGWWLAAAAALLLVTTISAGNT